GRALVRERARGGVQDVLHEAGGALGALGERSHVQRRHAGLLRVRVRERGGEAAAPQHHDRAVLLLGLEEQVDALGRRNLRAQALDEAPVLSVRRAARAALDDAALLSARGDVLRRGHLALALTAGLAAGAKDAAADVPPHRVVAEKREVARSAAR